jgi:Ca2+-binding RTX toxin-like protein
MAVFTIPYNFYLEITMATASAYTDVVQELYVSYFGRPADTRGLLAMSAALAAAAAPTDTVGLDAAYAGNAAVRALLDSFGASAESRALYGAAATGFDTVRFVSQIYHHLFERSPDPAGLAFWTRAIDSGALSQAGAAHAILSGAVAARNADAALIGKKVAVANTFTASMDTPAELDAYQGNLAARFGRELLAQVSATSDASALRSAGDAILAQLNGARVLTAGADKPVLASGPTLFLADLAGTGNSLQTGDSLSGGGASDTLRAVLGATLPGQVPMPATSGIEHVLLQAAGPLEPPGQTVLDAKLMNGVTRWQSDQSNGDLFIKNVAIQNGQLPEDVTIAMVDSSAGNADFAVYFTPSSLRASNPAAGASSLRLQLMDTRAADAGAAPLKDSPYDGFRFLLNKVPVQLRSAAIDQAQTYEELLAAIRTQVAATPALEKLVVSLGDAFQAYDTRSGQLLSGREIVLTNTGPGSIGVAPGAGWLQPGADVDVGTLAAGPASGARPLITSTIVLDNVGRGGVGGDLLVGAAPAPEATPRPFPYDDMRERLGIEAFNISVERSSVLQAIKSTDNTLQTVTLSNGAVKGDLTVLGIDNPNIPDAPLAGTDYFGRQYDGSYGFHDVRQIDASAMRGKVDLAVLITVDSRNKYLTAPGSRSGAPTETLDFVYVGGSNDDRLLLEIDYGLAGSRDLRLRGQEDFRFILSGGAGDDLLQASVSLAPENAKPWLADQDRNNNLIFDGGDGNDTIRKPGAGDAVIGGGAGDDTVYTENTGAQLVWVPNAQFDNSEALYLAGHWVFNTRNQGGALATARSIGNLDSDGADSYRLPGSRVEVSFRGLESKVTLGTTLLAPTSKDSDLNQAIKHAINDDAVLGKLLLATDGPGSTLLVRALIDGAMAAADLRVTLQAPAGAERSGIDAFNAKGDYRSALALHWERLESGAEQLAPVTGRASLAASDNLITAGAGNDVVVLGTAEADSLAQSSNDTLIFARQFGNDTIVGFDSAGNGIDHLDFSALGGMILSPALTLDKSVAIAAASGANDTAAKVGALFNADNRLAQTHVYAVVDASGNAAAIYAVADAPGANNAVATLEGTIDLGQVAWLSDLGAANIVDAGSAGYSWAEGASSAVPTLLLGVAPALAG